MNDFEQRSVGALVWVFLREAMSQDLTYQDDVNYWIDGIDEETPTEVLDYIMSQLREGLHEHYLQDYTVGEVAERIQNYIGSDFEDVPFYGMVSRVLLEWQVEDAEDDCDCD